jgi:uncharacterized glyoxalase superfamily protein PhnB
MEDRPILDQINLVVRDMAAMVDFYRQLGVEIQQAPRPWDQHHRTADTPEGIDLDLDSSTFARQWNQGWRDGESGAVLGFKVAERDTVDALYGRLTEAGYVGQQPPYDAFWGARYAVIEDPDGNPVGIMSRTDPQRRADPPTPG